MTRFLSFALAAFAVSSIVATVATGCGGSDCSSCNVGGATTASTTTTSETGGSGGMGGGTATSTTFLCKGMMCKRGSEACTVTSMNSQGDVGECTSLPLPCVAEDADCSCFTLMPECMCQKQVSGDFAIFCSF